MKLVSLMVLLTGCGAANFASKKHSSPDEAPASATPETAAFSLEGTWKSDCLSLSDTQHLTGTVIVTGNVKQVSVVYYLEANCATAGRIDREATTFQIVGDAPGLENTKEINFTTTSNTVEFSTDETVQVANKAEMYGYSDWVVGQPKDTAGKKESKSVAPDDSVGQIFYSIAKIVDGSPKQMLAGDIDLADGSSEDKRPKSVDATFVVKKQ